MKNIYLILGIAAIVLVVGAYLSTHGTPALTKALAYCGANGELTDTMSIQSHRSYCMKSDSSKNTFSAGTPETYRFSIIDDRGEVVKDFQTTHTKIMHVIAVRKDLAYFQHVHPEFDSSTGEFILKDLTFPTTGPYRIFADFAPASAQMDAMGMPLTVTVSEDVSIGNNLDYTPQPLDSEESTKTFDGLMVDLSTYDTPKSGVENQLMFSLSQNGKPITDLQSYLGALGHAVILREGTLDFIHTHPSEAESSKQNGNVNFNVYLPEAGRYKVFSQFQRNGKVITTDFVLTVEPNTGAAPDSMSGMHHSM